MRIKRRTRVKHSRKKLYRKKHTTRRTFKRKRKTINRRKFMKRSKRSKRSRKQSRKLMKGGSPDEDILPLLVRTNLTEHYGWLDVNIRQLITAIKYPEEWITEVPTAYWGWEVWKSALLIRWEYPIDIIDILNRNIAPLSVPPPDGGPETEVTLDTQ
jgi:hypothetical protein